MEKIMEIPGGRWSNAKPSGTENPVGWGVKLEKTLRGGVWIFSGTTHFPVFHLLLTTNFRSLFPCFGDNRVPLTETEIPLEMKHKA